jgi:glucosyl-3-phosphoglycerate phosphatase
MFLLRHGQSYFNLHFSATRVDPGIEDPELTAFGKQQAQLAAQQLSGVKLTRIIVSPYRRALQTAQPFLTTHRVPVDIMSEVRERAAFVCDVGSEPQALTAQFPHHDFAHLPSRWWSEAPEPHAQTVARADAFRSLMAKREDRTTTLLVSHWAFILALSGVSAGNGELLEYDPEAAPPEQLDWGP